MAKEFLGGCLESKERKESVALMYVKIPQPSLSKDRWDLVALGTALEHRYGRGRLNVGPTVFS